MTKPSLLAILLVTCAASCGGGADSPQTADEFVVAYRSAFCDNIGDCCRASHLLYDREHCATVFQFGRPAKIPLKYDAAAATTCLHGIKAAAAACTTISDDAAAACDRALVGNRQPGEPCQSQWDCAPSAKGFTRCRGLASARGGLICQLVRTAAKQGESCDTDLYAQDIGYCGKGLYCDESLHCAARLTEGEPCPNPTNPGGDACADGLSCEDVCVARGQGDPCGPDFVCGNTLGCDRQSCSCQPVTPTPKKKAGASCELDQECYNACLCGECVGPSLVTPDTCHGLEINFGSPVTCANVSPSAQASPADPTSPIDAGLPTCQPMASDHSACRGSSLGGRSDACKACACAASDTCPAALAACDSNCWSLLDCIAQQCPDFGKMAANMDFSCLTNNCSAYLGSASLIANVEPCIKDCGSDCVGGASAP